MSKLLEFIGTSIIFLVLVLIIALMVSVPVYFLWNYLMPELFGLKEISLFQALCLSLLTSFLFSSKVSQTKSK